MESKKKRPGGITFLGWFNAVVGCVFMLAALGSKTGPAAVSLLIAGAFSVIAGVGLLRLSGWGRVLAIIGYVLNIIGGIVQFNPIVIAVAGLVLAYLYSAQVKAAFALHPSPKPEAAPARLTDQKAA